MEVALLLIVQLTLLSTPSTPEAKLADGFSVDLFHRDSPLSPFYNSSMSRREVFINAALRSISRAKSLHNFNNVEAAIIPNAGDYLMKIFTGTPPAESLVTVDTGSTLIWVQCLPCNHCFQQDTPVFDPNKSSTYNKLSCGSNPCQVLSSTYCGQSGECRYRCVYGDGSVTKGEVANDVISFGSNGSQLATFKKTVFGCGHDNTWRPIRPSSQKSTGIVGLGISPMSLFSQLNHQIGRIFSYCLLPFYSNSTSKLIFGSQSTQSGAGVLSTPMVIKPTTFYYVTLEAISIDDIKVTPIEYTGGNMFIDSGTTLTKLEASFYESIELDLLEAIDDEPIPDPPTPLRLCYSGLTGSDLPDITFHFSGADLRLPVNNIFIALDDHLVCLSMVPHKGTSILGNLAQVNFKVEYDLERKTISFGRTDCSKE